MEVEFKTKSAPFFEAISSILACGGFPTLSFWRCSGRCLTIPVTYLPYILYIPSQNTVHDLTLASPSKFIASYIVFVVSIYWWVQPHPKTKVAIAQQPTSEDRPKK